MFSVKYQVIGLMSGTSLDGLDIAFCEFRETEKKWTYQIHCAETIRYTDHWKKTLSNLESGTALDFVTADVAYGHLLGTFTRDFILRNKLNPDFIASHGHTIFHQPDKRITSQIGRGAAIAAETGLRVICDFRSLDVALGGQGAPLVPIGDALLFNQYDFCLNIGGFVNISYQTETNRIAYDICPANIVMNLIASLSGYDFDPDGSLAAAGTVNSKLLDDLNLLPYYQLEAPKSLGKEWVVQHFFPMLNSTDLPSNDLLATVCEHIALQVAAATGLKREAKLLITGGGAFNKFLISRIRYHAVPEIIIPDDYTINFKEALIFAFLGVLRWRNELNCLQSVTGAANDSSGGAIY
jgi:anhydro-N-acetylmuramic acid kinase